MHVSFPFPVLPNRTSLAMHSWLVWVSFFPFAPLRVVMVPELELASPFFTRYAKDGRRGGGREGLASDVGTYKEKQTMKTLPTKETLRNMLVAALHTPFFLRPSSLHISFAALEV